MFSVGQMSRSHRHVTRATRPLQFEPGSGELRLDLQGVEELRHNVSRRNCVVTPKATRNVSLEGD
jgi:hypothetical protein